MKKKIFISYSYSNRDKFLSFHHQLKEYLEKEFKLSVYSFVFDFTEKVSDKELMDIALSKVGSSDIFIVELSYKSIGIGIEAGYAKSVGIPVIYLVREGVDAESTMKGISDYIVEYSSVSDVIQWAKDNPHVFTE